MSSASPSATRVLSVRDEATYIRQFALTVTAGPDAGVRVVSSGAELTIGTEDGTDLRLTDTAVSRHHAVLSATELGLEIRDLSSTNGTRVGECRLALGYVNSGATLRVGRTTIAVEILDDEIKQPMAPTDRYGELIGASPAMRRLFPLLESCSGSDATVLLTGETGTGKEVCAEAIHRASARRGKPFIVVDCGALPRQLLESELFGHVRGAFTGAELDRIGAFEAADGGTIFLDEIGELALELQPILLRALESRTVRRVGGSRDRSLDVRIIAATNRDLRVEVNERRFRADLYFRLNVLRVELPPLRDRAGDVALLARYFWSQFRPGADVPSDLIASLDRGPWPGNVRELRNAVERAALIGWRPEETAGEAEALSFGEAKERANKQWERSYIERLLAASGGNLSRAAKTARMSRSHLRLLLGRHGLERADFEDQN